eukprot:2059117-Rhodomonas_salina.1
MRFTRCGNSSLKLPDELLPSDSARSECAGNGYLSNECEPGDCAVQHTARQYRALHRARIGRQRGSRTCAII